MNFDKAYKIKLISHANDVYDLKCENGDTVRMTAEEYQRERPAVGGYFLTRNGGPSSCCSASDMEGFLEANRSDPVIENNFVYHAPKTGQQEKYVAIREKAKELTYLMKEHCPSSRESSVAMTHLETSVFWANAAIARN